MSENLARKLIQVHWMNGDWRPGSDIALKVDQTLTQGATGTLVMLASEAMKLDRVRTDVSVQYVDHNLIRSDHRSPDDHLFLESACRRFGLWYSSAGNGVSHPLHMKYFGRPGDLLLGSDSHTPAAGGLGMPGLGAGGLDVAMAMAGHPLAMTMPQIWGVSLEDLMGAWISAKNIALEMLRRHGVRGGLGFIIDYHGPGVAQLSAMDRHVIANMGTELGATSSVFPSDEIARAFMRQYGREDAWLRTPTPITTATNKSAIDEDLRWWREWIGRSHYNGRWREQVERSLITLKALTYAPTGGVVAAPTTSLPEHFGGMRNWDYRLCWLRDATLTLYALLNAGYHAEARAWREWLLRAAAGRPQDIRILYGIAGERDISERTIEHLPGYQGAHPVRTGNAAADQFQLDVYGEVMDTLHVARAHGLAPSEDASELQRTLLDFLESNWDQVDNGIWEVRGPKRHFTHSKVMVWVALDRAIRGAERFGLQGPTDRWSALRDQVHRQVCERGYDAERNTFTQYYGGSELDASLLQIPLVGFLPGSDRRVGSTLAAIENELLKHGFLLRYIASEKVEDLSEDEGVFLPCSFWLADNYALLGRAEEAERLFERLLGLTNDLGLISEEYDPDCGRLLGNFPQAFTHVALINTARNLSHGGGSNERRGANAENRRA